MRAEAQTFLHGDAPMADRLSPGTFLSMLRHPETGKQLDAEVYARLTREETDDEPRDCVRQFPTLKEDITQLVGYDVSGQPRIKIELPREDAGWWESLIMRYVRWKYGRPIRIVR
jgi:hypothetical protein